MLRPYKLVYSKIHKVNSFINHVMLDVIFRAPRIHAAAFSSALVLPKYRDLIDNINAEYILDPLTEAFGICKGLQVKQLKILRHAVHINNKIRELCNGMFQPVSYGDIERINSPLANALKTFNYKMYDEVLKREPCYNAYETIDAYYKRLQGRSSVCRCCGVNKVLTQFHSHRSALDHYLPRKHYPFSAINFKNLFPICDTCNSKYKLSEDPLTVIEDKGKKTERKRRVKAFHPFSRTIPEIDIKLELKDVTKISEVEPKNMTLTIQCAGYEEQIETWDRVFGIKENYTAACCTEEMISFVEEQYVAYKSYGLSHVQYIDLLGTNKYDAINFLRIPFLKAIEAK